MFGLCYVDERAFHTLGFQNFSDLIIFHLKTVFNIHLDRLTGPHLPERQRRTNEISNEFFIRIFPDGGTFRKFGICCIS